MSLMRKARKQDGGEMDRSTELEEWKLRKRYLDHGGGSACDRSGVALIRESVRFAVVLTLLGQDHAPINPKQIIYSSSFSCLLAFLIKILFCSAA